MTRFEVLVENLRSSTKGRGQRKRSVFLFFRDEPEHNVISIIESMDVTY